MRIVAVFRSFETGLRGATIYPSVRAGWLNLSNSAPTAGSARRYEDAGAEPDRAGGGRYPKQHRQVSAADPQYRKD